MILIRHCEIDMIQFNFGNIALEIIIFPVIMQCFKLSSLHGIVYLHILYYEWDIKCTNKIIIKIGFLDNVMLIFHARK